MAKIQITRNLLLEKPLVNNNGERVDRIRLKGSFAFSEFRNEDYIEYDRINDDWTFNLDSLIQEFTNPLQTQINDLQSQINDLQSQINGLNSQ